MTKLVLVSDNETNLQEMLKKMGEWCTKWRVKISQEKNNIVHFRPKRKKRTRFNFTLSGFHPKIVSSYKYLGVIFDEFLNFNLCSETLAESSGRAVNGIISKIKTIKDLGFNTFSTLYSSGATPIMDYGAGIWGFAHSSPCDLVQNKTLRYYMGVHRFAPTAALHGESGWMMVRHRHLLSMPRLWNRLIAMDSNRQTKRVFLLDLSISNNNW